MNELIITALQSAYYWPSFCQDNEKDSPECEEYMYAGQWGLQRLLVILAVVCVPWMLLAKPFLKKKEAASKPSEHFDFMEVMILQGGWMFVVNQ